MNRRHFIQAFLGTPLLTPLLLTSQRAVHDSELYLISDHPQSVLPSLLETLHNSRTPGQKTFAFLNPHPFQEDLKNLLRQRGWSPVAHPAQSDMTLSFSLLHHKACPSFTLVRNGKILDIRGWRFNSLWQSMTKAASRASLLTTAAFSGKPSPLKGGHAVSLYKDGHQIARLPLKGSWTRRIPTKQGPITVRMHAGQTWIAESSCLHKICVSTPPIARAGERIICAPNHFLLEIQGRMVDTVIG